MKPIKLTMSAFGPYAKVELIDFTKLNGRNIFLITGPTGAGKTTVFDGISYGIYGYANGEDRDGESLRSHFSKEDVLTYVELEFELRGKKYIIKRIPKQIRKRTKGEGTTEQKPEAELTYFLGEDKKVITGVNNVNEKINEIMGINNDQFRQIMMIPQGEFRRLLTSESKDREKILQKIFGTIGYKKVEYKLVDTAKQILGDVKKLKENLNENITRVNCFEFKELEDEINSESRNFQKIVSLLKNSIHVDEENQKEIENAIEAFNKSLKQKQTEIIKGEENNKKLLAKEEVIKEKTLLEEKNEYIKDLSKKVKMGKNALLVFSTEKNLNGRKNDLVGKNQYLSNVKEKLNKSEIDFNISKEKYNKEISREEERSQFLREITLLKGYIDRAEKIKTIEQQCEKANQDLKNIISKRDKSKADIEILKNSIIDLNNRFEEARNASISYLDVSKELTSVISLQDIINKLHKENEELINIRKQYLEYKRIWDEDGKKLEEEKSHFEEMQQNFYKGQAGILAGKLQDGIACPVCGSLHHPLPAEGESNLPSEESLNREKEKIRSIENAEKISREKFSLFEAKGISQKDIVDNIKKELGLLIKEDINEISKQQLSEFINSKQIQVMKVRKDLENKALELENKKMLEEKINKELTVNKKILEEKGKELDIINDNYNKISGFYTGIKASKEQLEKELPEDVRSLEILQEKISTQQNKYDMLIKLFKDVEKEYKALEITFEKNKSELGAAEMAANQAASSVKEAENSFAIEIIKHGFCDEKEYEACKLSSENIENYDNDIKDYNEKLKSVVDRYDKILLETSGIIVTNINDMKIEYEKINSTCQELFKNKTELFSKMQNNKKSLSRIEEIEKIVISKEEEYRIVGDLAEVAKGNNSERITFERYVLAAFFDDIIISSNIRLNKMTNGRYELNRIGEKGKGLAQSGLELEVFDNYTGKYRHVKTLSGGEGFKASLSLALGLADVVQSYAGGISLDTMFIDEGFGTLDSESLENAIECLIDLQKNGRLVGIISHVPELKERIDAKLEIEPSNQGSVTKFNIGHL